MKVSFNVQIPTKFTKMYNFLLVFQKRAQILNKHASLPNVFARKYEWSV